MRCNFCQIYFLQQKEKGFFGLSPYPLLDFTYYPDWEEIVILTKPLPLVLGQYLLGKVKQPAWWQRIVSTQQLSPGLEEGLTKLKKAARGLPVELIWEVWQERESLPNPELLEEALTILAGRCLWEEEALRALKERHFSLWQEGEKILHLLYLQGKVEKNRGIDDRGKCQRCGNKKLETRPCYINPGFQCLVCPECSSLGQGRLCSLLYSFPAKTSLEKKTITCQLEFPLTLPQKEASARLEEFLQQEKKECLLWAVCGAGKTEVVYGVIRQVLAQGEKVLLAIPRQEVVRELLPRLQRVFPQVQMAALYGGKKEKYGAAQLVIATTHQTIRFFQHFALVVLDEVDAYPYPDSQMLHYAVQRACRPEGKIIYLTATPEKELLKLPTITIPARHHRFPLPEPELLARPLPKDISKEGLPADVLNFLDESVEKDHCQVFVFLPTIRLTVEVGQWLKEYYQQTKGADWVEYSHSKDKGREEKKQRFSQGVFPFLVTTTIMERGVTIPRLNVLVLHSEQEKIFNTASLIQMAGRVGRKEEYPQGRVLFWGDKITFSMLEAKKIIKSFNQEGREKGYLYSN